MDSVTVNSLEHSCFVFGRSLVQISVQAIGYPGCVFVVFLNPSSDGRNSTLKIKPLLLPTKSFPSHNRSHIIEAM
jgi:hypothetical protein